MSLKLEKYYGTFGCYHFEENIWNQIDKAIEKNELPDFSMYDNFEVGVCDCGAETCMWDKESILDRLKEKGVWQDIMKELDIKEDVLQFTSKDFLGTFGCFNMEEEVRTYVNTELAKGEMPDFSVYNDPHVGHCTCRTSSCEWNEETIIERLKAKGIWQKIELAIK